LKESHAEARKDAMPSPAGMFDWVKENAFAAESLRRPFDTDTFGFSCMFFSITG
jgi:hypothetical protein